MDPLKNRLEQMLASGEDSALLRFSLGNAYLDDDPSIAITHLQRATEIDSQYSAAWKLLGKAFANSGDVAAAIETYRRGVEIAESNGDKQAAREMSVFLRRLERDTD